MKLLLWLTALLAAVGLGILAPGPASAATSYCGLAWGSQDKTAPEMSSASVTNVRTGQQHCFDRMVVDLNGPARGYTVRYVPEIIQDGTGFTIPVYGNARLQVVVNAPSYDNNGNVTYNPAAKAELSYVAGYQTFRKSSMRIASKVPPALAWASAPGCPSGSSPWTGQGPVPG